MDGWIWGCVTERAINEKVLATWQRDLDFGIKKKNPGTCCQVHTTRLSESEWLTLSHYTSLIVCQTPKLVNNYKIRAKIVVNDSNL